MIEAYLVQRVERGMAEDRAGVVAALKEAGFAVPREGTHYVTVLDPARGDRWRLKGALYEHDFQRERLERPAPAPDGGRGPGDDRDRRARSADVWRDVERQRERHATYHRSRYGGAGRSDSRAAVARMAPVPGSRAVRLSGHFGGSWGLTQWQSSRVERLVERQEALRLAIAQEQQTLEQPQGADVGRVALRGGGRDEARAISQGGVRRGLAVDRARAACRAAFERVRAWYDRARDTLDWTPWPRSRRSGKADQDQQAFEQSEVDARLQELAQQVTDFAEQHEQQAAALQAQLQHLDTQVGLLTTQYAGIAADYKALAALLARA